MAITRTQMLALLADNTAGDISAQDMRDIITGVLTIEDDYVEVQGNSEAVLKIVKALKIRTDKATEDLNNVLDEGIYEVSDSLDSRNHPTGENQGILKVIAADSNTSMQQNYLSVTTGKDYLRVSVLGDGTDFTVWVETKASQRVSTLESRVPFELSYNFVKSGGLNISSDVFSPIATLPTVAAPAGSTFEIKVSMSTQYSETSRSAYIRFSIDGGINWKEYVKEAKDATDVTPFFYSFPKTFPTATDIDLVLEGRCENSSDVFTINYADLIAERKD